MNRSYILVWNTAQQCWQVAHEGARRQGRRGKPALAATAAAAALLGLAAVPSAHALPSGQNVAGGSADIQKDASQQAMSINQKTDKLIIDWNDFNIGAGERVSFNQPGSAAVALNRVIGNNSSEIFGRMEANGRVFLVNPNGVLFGKSAQVNLGGLVASTHGISDQQFLAPGHNYSFTDSNSPNAVVNEGTLTAAVGGSIALLGGRVRNDGLILAPMGSVALGAGGDAMVRFGAADGLLNLEINGAAADALAHNGGLLKADGGQVLMTARGSGALLQAVVNNVGAIEANTLSRRAGKITLDGGDVGRTFVGGRLSTSAMNTVGDGGEVVTRGRGLDVGLGLMVDTRASNGMHGNWTLSAPDMTIGRYANDSSANAYSGTLAQNLATTHIKARSETGDLSLKGPVAWNSSNHLSLEAAGSLHVNAPVSASGIRAGLMLNAGNQVNINDKLTLSGTASELEINAPGGRNFGDKGSVTLSGSSAGFTANGIRHTVIQNVAQLQQIDTNLYGHYVLGNGITGGRLLSIGGPYGVFRGSFDGLGNTISGLSITGRGANVGVFSEAAGSISNVKLANLSVTDNAYGPVPGSVGALAGVNRGLIRNVSTERVNVSSNTSRSTTVGGLVGINTGTLENVSTSGSVYGGVNARAVGGVAGENILAGAGDPAAIRGAVSRAQVSGGVLNDIGGGIGGIAGVNNGGTLQDVRSEGAVTASRAGVNAGGIAGLNANAGTIESASASGRVQGNQRGNAGGVVGLNSGATIAASQASGQVNGSATANLGGIAGLNANGGRLAHVAATGPVVDASGANVGGVVGANSFGTVSHATASGQVRAGNSSRVGGVVGSNLYGGEVLNAKGYSDVSGGSTSLAGGVAGYNLGALTAAEGHGKVTAGNNASAGGVAGANLGTIVGGIGLGEVTGGSRSNVGGVVGDNQGTVSYSHANGSVRGGTYAALGGLAGVNRSVIDYSTAATRVNYQPAGYQQVYGGLAGLNTGRMTGNVAYGAASLLPPAGSNSGLLQ